MVARPQVVVRRLRSQSLMRVPSSVKLVAATWVAALLGALAGRSLAEAMRADAHSEKPTTVAAGVRTP